jgi:hypothetical protein
MRDADLVPAEREQHLEALPAASGLSSTTSTHSASPREGRVADGSDAPAACGGRERREGDRELRAAAAALAPRARPSPVQLDEPLTSVSPMPSPPCERASVDSSCAKSSNTGCISTGTPIPVSRTLTTASPAAPRAVVT